MIAIDNDFIELTLIHPVYKPDTDGEVLKELRVRRLFQREDVTSIQEYVTPKNTIAKNRCLIFDKNTSQFYGVFHSMEEVREAKKSKPVKNQVGYQCQ